MMCVNIVLGPQPRHRRNCYEEPAILPQVFVQPKDRTVFILDMLDDVKGADDVEFVIQGPWYRLMKQLDIGEAIPDMKTAMTGQQSGRWDWA